MNMFLFVLSIRDESVPWSLIAVVMNQYSILLRTVMQSRLGSRLKVPKRPKIAGFGRLDKLDKALEAAAVRRRCCRNCYTFVLV